MRMGDGVNWIAHAFKLFDALINPRRSTPADRPVATESCESLAPEAFSDSAAAPILPLEPTSDGDALAPHDESKVESLPVEHIESPPVQRDDESQRKLIRQLFNEYWAGIEDKPPTFAERLQIAERYINEKLADRDIGWRLDAATRKQLGLPSSPTVG
jgi:hypothetical protein